MMADRDYIESIAGRVDDRPEQRAELSDRLHDAEQALGQAADWYMQTFACELEGFSDTDRHIIAQREERREKYEQALAEFNAALEAAGEFLRAGEGAAV